jgi:hypothetical protein
MMKNDSPLYAVLTGDLVKSSRLPAEDFHAVKDGLKNAVRQLNGVIEDNSPGLVKGSIDFYRGDGWQLLLTRPAYALRACLYLRACLKAHTGIDTRISVGVGEVSHIDPKNISQSIGKAFELSGKGLDDLKSLKRMTIAFPYYMDSRNSNLVSVFELCDAIVQKWTEKQAEAVSWALQGLNQSEIAEKFSPPIKQQSVGLQLKSASWHALQAALERTEEQESLYRQI